MTRPRRQGGGRGAHAERLRQGRLARGAEGAARQALGRLSGALGVRRDTSDLGLMRDTHDRRRPAPRFQQYVKGVPVRNGQVAVALGKNGSVLHVASARSPDTTLDTRHA